MNPRWKIVRAKWFAVAAVATAMPPALATTIFGACQYTTLIGSTVHLDYSVGTLPTTVYVNVDSSSKLAPNQNGDTSACFSREVSQQFDIYIIPGQIKLGTVTAVIVQAGQTLYFWRMQGGNTFAMPRLPAGSYSFTTTEGLDKAPRGDDFRVLAAPPPPPPPPPPAMEAFSKFIPAITMIVRN